MTELSFLIEILLNHDLPKDTKALIATRIKEVEEKLNKPATISYNTSGFVTQAPSTLARMAMHGDSSSPIPIPPEAQSVAVDMIAQTPMAAAAMQQRQLVMDGKKQHDPATGRPRKW